MKILFQGDSITDGARYKDPAFEWDKNHQIGHSYAYIIAAKLGFEDPTGYEFVNRGISGNNVHQLEERWEADSLSHDPDLLSILIGINGNGRTEEGKYVGDVDKNVIDYTESYRRILKSSLEKNPALQIVIIEPFALPVGPYATDYADFSAKLGKVREAARNVSEEFGAIFIPIQDELTALASETDPALWLWDGIHPTERGHWLIASRWLESTAHLLNKK